MSKWLRAAERVSSLEQTNKWAAQANERTEERVAQYFNLDSWLFWTVVHWWEKNDECCHDVGRLPPEASFFLSWDPQGDILAGNCRLSYWLGWLYFDHQKDNKKGHFCILLVILNGFDTKTLLILSASTIYIHIAYHSCIATNNFLLKFTLWALMHDQLLSQLD